VRVLITGGSGTLGSHLARAAAFCDDEILAPSRGDLDVTDLARARAFVHASRPDVIVHCAAVIRTRDANQPEMWAATSRVNVHGTGCIGRAAAEVDAKLVAVSTDFVFDGRKPGGMYGEDDLPCPLGYYALSKYAGEQLALRAPRAVVVRTTFCADDAWPYPRAFVDRFTSKQRVSLVAQQLALVAKSDLVGVLHVGGPRQSYFELARSIRADVLPMSMADVAEDAGLLPVDTSLDCARWRRYCADHGIDA